MYVSHTCRGRRRQNASSVFQRSRIKLYRTEANFPYNTSAIFLSSSWQNPRRYVKIGHCHLLPNPPLSVIRNTFPFKDSMIMQ
jgi:hypothetical protein